MTQTVRLLGMALLFLSSTPAAAAAYSLADRFDQPTTAGGGGGRRFTGSFADGYTCAVCHGEAESDPPDFSVRSATSMEPPVLWDDWTGGFVPGQRYEFVIPIDNAAFALEVTDAEGRALGHFTVPRDLLSSEVARCVESDAAAARVYAFGDREVVASDACGARQAKLEWEAPASTGPAFLHLVTVEGDDSGDATGDQVREREAIVLAPGDLPVESVVTHGGCNTSAPDSSTSQIWLGFALSALLLVHRRRRAA